MTTIDVTDAAGNKSGSVELPPDVFAAQVNVPLIHQVVVAQLAAARQGTHSTKTRGEVSGGGRKPYRQKGTGRARQGSIRAPQFAGGGVVHGPTPRDHAQRVPKKMKAAALRGALSDRAAYGRVHVVDRLVDGDAPSTKSALAALARLTDRRHVLVVVARGDDVTTKSLRNAPRVHLIPADQLNTYDVLCADDVVFTQAALEAFLSGGRAAQQDGKTAVSADVQSTGGEATVTENAEPVPDADPAAASDVEAAPRKAGTQRVTEEGAA
ncbi:MAG: 50S ribosomal protein L4 [Jiangellaceae bacterium]|nr:50S ribosomal protein L4 [Jiangellaceae bacterium]